MSGVPQAGRSPGQACSPHIVKTFLLKKTKQNKNLETQNTKKIKENILVLLHFNQAIVLLWCSHYAINDDPEPAQTGGEN